MNSKRNNTVQGRLKKGESRNSSHVINSLLDLFVYRPYNNILKEGGFFWVKVPPPWPQTNRTIETIVLHQTTQNSSSFQHITNTSYFLNPSICILLLADHPENRNHNQTLIFESSPTSFPLLLSFILSKLPKWLQLHHNFTISGATHVSFFH